MRSGSIEPQIELIHTEGNHSHWNMPYTPAIKVRGGALLFVSGVTAAPIYHSHPHVADEFDYLPEDPATQTELAMENLERVLTQANGSLTSIVQLVRFIVDLDRNQDAVNTVMGRRLAGHRAASTTIEVVRVATDPRLVLELQATAVVPE